MAPIEQSVDGKRPEMDDPLERDSPRARIERAADIREALRGVDVDVDELLHAAANSAMKGALRAATDQAITEGVFGVPMCRLDHELDWGEDALDDMVLELESGGPQPDERLAPWLSIRASAQRQP